MQLDSFAPRQLDDGQANRVRTSRRPGRKYTVRTIVGGRCAQQPVPTQFQPRGTIELPDDDEMREALDVGEPQLKLRQDLEHTIDLVFSAKPLGNFACVLVRTTHKTNRVRGKHRGRSPPLPIVPMLRQEFLLIRMPRATRKIVHWSELDLCGRASTESAVRGNLRS